MWDESKHEKKTKNYHEDTKGNKNSVSFCPEGIPLESGAKNLAVAWGEKKSIHHKSTKSQREREQLPSAAEGFLSAKARGAGVC